MIAREPSIIRPTGHCQMYPVRIDNNSESASTTMALAWPKEFGQGYNNIIYLEAGQMYLVWEQ